MQATTIMPGEKRLLTGKEGDGLAGTTINPIELSLVSATLRLEHSSTIY
jgi:hypothetical protein